MSQLETIFQAIEYMEGNLKEDLSIADVADAVGYSLYHFCRTFNTLTHHTPYDYLVRRRLAESASELAGSKRKIIDIACDYQFNNAETYSRAFKRLTGLQPKQWRQQKGSDCRLLMHRITLEHLSHLNNGNYLKPIVGEKPAFQVIGLMSRLTEDRRAIAELWEALQAEIQRLARQIRRLHYYGILWYSHNKTAPDCFYMAALKTDSTDTAHTALVEKSFPPLHLARFIHKGPDRRLDLTRDYIYHTWLPKSGRRLGPAFEIEYYGEYPPSCDDEESERMLFIPIDQR